MKRMRKTLALALYLALPLAAQHVEHNFSLQADSPDFWKLIAKDTQLQTVGSGFGFTEGPVWEEGGSLIISDEEANVLFRLYPDGHRVALLKLGDPDGNTRDLQGRLIVTASVLRSLIRINADEKSYITLVDRYQGMRLNSPNDVVPGPDGALYFTDPTLDLVKGEKQETPFQGVYRLGAKGDLTLLIRDLSQPNGLAFSPDGKTLYVDDTERRTIWKYAFGSDGTVSDGKLFAEERKDESGPGAPDGMKVDRKGNLYVTGPGGIWVWRADGQRLGRILLPHTAANLTWGGKDRSVLFITAGPSVYSLQTRTTGFVPYETKSSALTGARSPEGR
jgi:gluconolactonase